MRAETAYLCPKWTTSKVEVAAKFACLQREWTTSNEGDERQKAGQVQNENLTFESGAKISAKID